MTQLTKKKAEVRELELRTREDVEAQTPVTNTVMMT